MLPILMHYLIGQTVIKLVAYTETKLAVPTSLLWFLTYYYCIIVLCFVIHFDAEFDWTNRD